MNFFSRMISMPPLKLAKKLLGFNNMYSIAYRRYNPQNNILNNSKVLFNVLTNDKEHWYADPVIFDYNNKTYVFMEAFERKNLIGRIACCELGDEGFLSSPKIIISEQFHMSFPTIIEWKGKILMIPETCECNSLNIYECNSFPESWVLSKSFDLGSKLVDTIVLEKNNDRVTLLSSKWQEPYPLSTKFQIHYLKMKNNEFTLEADNEFNIAQSYNTENRNAGSLFKVSTRYIHPIQVSTNVQYGAYMNFWNYHGSDRLKNEKICCVKPDNVMINGIKHKAIVGIHSYCHNSLYEIIDVCYTSYNPFKYYYMIRKKLRLRLGK